MMAYEITLSSDDSNGSQMYTSGYCSDSVQYSPDSNSRGPYIEITEQPGDYRYRYEKERYHGHILGISSPQTKKKDMCKFPSIKIHNYQNDVLVRCWLISPKLESPTAHFHKLARKLPKGEIQLEPHAFYATDRNNYEVTFDYLHIVHAVMSDPNDIKIYLRKKAWLESGSFECPKNIDYSDHDNEKVKTIEKNQSILYFEAYDRQTGIKLCDAVSRKIKNLHNPETSTLKIVNCSRTYGTCKGGDEVFILVEKIPKDVDVRFFEKKQGSTERGWQARGEFGPQNIHHQYAIVFRTPRFRDIHLKRDAEVYFELFRRGDGATSDPVKFTFKPDEHCRMYELPKKRPHSPERLITNNGSVFLSEYSIKKSRDGDNMSPDSTTSYSVEPQDLYSDLFEFPEGTFADLLSGEGDSHLPEAEDDILQAPVLGQLITLDPYHPDLQLLLFNGNQGLSTDSIPARKKENGSKKEGMIQTQCASSVCVEFQGPKTFEPKNISSHEISSTNETDIDSTDKEKVAFMEFKKMVDSIKSNKTIESFEKMLQDLSDDYINAVDYKGNTIFLIASQFSKEALQILLKCKNVKRNIKNLDGDNALLCAVRRGKLDTVEVLLKNGFEPNDQNNRTGETALHLSVSAENMTLINLLLQYGANPLIDNYGSLSAYDYSSYSENKDMRKLIYDKAQEFFKNQRNPLLPEEYRVPESDLIKDLQTLKVSS